MSRRLYTSNVRRSSLQAAPGSGRLDYYLRQIALQNTINNQREKPTAASVIWKHHAPCTFHWVTSVSRQAEKKNVHRRDNGHQNTTPLSCVGDDSRRHKKQMRPPTDPTQDAEQIRTHSFFSSSISMNICEPVAGEAMLSCDAVKSPAASTRYSRHAQDPRRTEQNHHPKTRRHGAKGTGSREGREGENKSKPSGLSPAHRQPWCYPPARALWPYSSLSSPSLLVPRHAALPSLKTRDGLP